MRVALSLRGKAKMIKIYDLTNLEERGFNISNANLSQQEDVDRLFEIANELTDSGESQEYQDPFLDLHCAEAEDCTLTFRNEEEIIAEIDEVTLENISAKKILQKMEQSENGSVFFVKIFSGDALWDFETESEDAKIEPSKLSIGYFDCAYEMDQEESRSCGFYDLICDSLLTDKINYQGNKFELQDFVFHTMQVNGTFFIVRENEESNIKTLEAVAFGGKEISDSAWSELRDLGSAE